MKNILPFRTLAALAAVPPSLMALWAAATTASLTGTGCSNTACYDLCAAQAQLIEGCFTELQGGAEVNCGNSYHAVGEVTWEAFGATGKDVYILDCQTRYDVAVTDYDLDRQAEVREQCTEDLRTFAQDTRDCESLGGVLLPCEPDATDDDTGL